MSKWFNKFIKRKQSTVNQQRPEVVHELPESDAGDVVLSIIMSADRGIKHVTLPIHPMDAKAVLEVLTLIVDTNLNNYTSRIVQNMQANKPRIYKP